MKSEAEIRRAKKHLIEAASSAAKRGFPEEGGIMLISADLLAWVLDQPNAFGPHIMEPSDAVDRAKRQ